MGSVINHPLFSRVWPKIGSRLDSKGATEHRHQLVAGLGGDVLEVGCGDGRLFAYYPDSVGSVTAVEPEEHLRALAEQAAAAATVSVTVTEGRAEELPFDDATFDAVVCSLVLCSVADQPRALAEISRVLRPGGQLRFYEHVVARQPLGRAAQRALDVSRIWPTLGAGCHVSRDTPAALERAGLAIESIQRFTFPRPGMPHVIGTAVRSG